MVECVHIMLQDIHEHSDWVPWPEGSIYVMKTMITATTMISENISQLTGDDKRRSPMVYIVVRSNIKVVNRLTSSVLQFKLISVGHVIT